MAEVFCQRGLDVSVGYISVHVKIVHFSNILTDRITVGKRCNRSSYTCHSNRNDRPKSALDRFNLTIRKRFDRCIIVGVYPPCIRRTDGVYNGA